MKKKEHVIKKIVVNLITFSRILATILVVPVFVNFGPFSAALLVGGFFLTDAVDGFLARRWGVQSFFGSLLDTAADKILAITSLIALSVVNPLFLIPALLEVLIVLINIVKFSDNKNVKTSIIGKLKTGILALGISSGFLFAEALTNDIFLNIDEDVSKQVITGAAVVTSCSSLLVAVGYGLDYFKQEESLEKIRLKKQELIEKQKNIKELMKDLLDTEYYLEHKNEPIKKILYK